MIVVNMSFRKNNEQKIKTDWDYKPPKTYDDNVFGRMEKGLDNLGDSDFFKTADKLATIYKDKKIDIDLPKDKGTLTLGKIGTYDPLGQGERADLKWKQRQGELSPDAKIPGKVNTMGVKWTFPIGKKT